MHVRTSSLIFASSALLCAHAAYIPIPIPAPPYAAQVAFVSQSVYQQPCTGAACVTPNRVRGPMPFPALVLKPWGLTSAFASWS
ncbi:hypothetical protein DFH07DRAFT_968340 [Mycena maculata]|uniref:Secreted protein n=1 Tax=Mycena maculata TaxID=230809 RepID=A0AAD7I2D7_9AGAR|nr:hypothetical protein DFH07DRAFT_968340 [Mycena maculata]